MRAALVVGLAFAALALYPPANVNGGWVGVGPGEFRPNPPPQCRR